MRTDSCWLQSSSHRSDRFCSRRFSHFESNPASPTEAPSETKTWPGRRRVELRPTSESHPFCFTDSVLTSISTARQCIVVLRRQICGHIPTRVCQERTASIGIASSTPDENRSYVFLPFVSLPRRPREQLSATTFSLSCRDR